jgi:mRNA-degrading endonuclease toxin of MazEF toxin-antitoxin module
MTDQSQAHAIDRSRLMRRFGHLSEVRMAEIDHATQLVPGFLAV